jgi:hypothetical protein
MGGTSIVGNPALAPPGRRSFSLNHQRSLSGTVPWTTSTGAPGKKGWRMFHVINQPNSGVYTNIVLKWIHMINIWINTNVYTTHDKILQILIKMRSHWGCGEHYGLPDAPWASDENLNIFLSTLANQKGTWWNMYNHPEINHGSVKDMANLMRALFEWSIFYQNDYYIYIIYIYRYRYIYIYTYI